MCVKSKLQLGVEDARDFESWRGGHAKKIAKRRGVTQLFSVNSEIPIGVPSVWHFARHQINEN
jgi:hypothetical protein